MVAAAASNLRASRRSIRFTPEKTSFGQIIPATGSWSMSEFSLYPADRAHCQLARCTQADDGISSRFEFHGGVAVIFQLCQFAKNIRIVDLAGSRLMTSRHVGDMN